MKKWFFSFLLHELLPLFCFSQVSDAEATLLRRLDSVQQSNSVAKHFARIYFETTKNAVDFFYKADEPVRRFIQRFETRFADYFFQSAQAHEQKDTISRNWSVYYAETSVSDIQYTLLGANAHINGDIWKALTTEFAPGEIRKYKQDYFKYQKGLKKIYLSIYEDALGSSSKIRFLDNMTLGLDKLYGSIMLSRWRRRQVQLAILYFTDHTRFEKKLGKLQKKMDHLNYLILHHL